NRQRYHRCTRLRVAKIPRLRSWAHCCTAHSLRLGATSRLAALASGLRKSLACVRGLIVAPPTHFGSAQQVGSLHSPPGCEYPSLAFVGSLLLLLVTGVLRLRVAVGLVVVPALFGGLLLRLFDDVELDAAVGLAPRLGLVVGDGHRRAEAGGDE